jgi:FeS assembly protein IscX
MPKKSQKKLNWNDLQEIAFRLIDEHPQRDPRRLSTQEIFEMVTELPDFSDKTKPSSSKIEELATRWYEERSDMDDELGSLDDLPKEELDEDDYREDRQVEEIDEDSDTTSLDELEEDDDEEEDEF